MPDVVPPAGRRRLRRRLVWVFAGFSAALGLAFGVVVLAVYFRVEDRFVRRQLEEALAPHLTAPAPPRLVRSGSLTVGPIAEMPAPLAERLGEPRSGYYEVDLVDAERHVLVDRHPASGDHLFASMQFDESERTERQLAVAVWVAVAATLACGLLLGRLLARWVVSPIEHLTGRLARDPAAWADSPLAEGLRDDEIGLLARTLEDSMVRQRRALDRERLFIQEASHELRTPITVVRGVCDLLREGAGGADPLFQRRLARIDRSTRRMGLTVQSLLAMAREEHRRGAAEASGSFRDQLGDLVDEYRSLLPATVELRARIEGDGPPGAAAGMLIVALGNLLGNAAEHTEEGHIAVTVTPHRATVEDTGTGMAPEMARRLGESWQSAPETGLGLAIVQRICRRFGWRLDLRSRPGDGTEARIELRTAD